jgi:cell division protein ZapA (FtsZ GTPase activity inhibitor)
MTKGKTSVRVTILGDEYTLRSATSAEETQLIAKQVDLSIREIMQSGLVVETHKAAILACLRTAGELAQAQAEAARLAAQMTALSQEIRPWLPPAKRYD